MNIKTLFFFSFFAFITSTCFSQELIGTAADNASNSNGSLSWSIGEPIVETYSSDNGYLTQGFQQSSSIIITSVDNSTNVNGISAYPNPTTTSINIVHTDYTIVKVELIDIYGRTLIAKTLSGTDNAIDLGLFVSGIYYIRVYNSDNSLIKVLSVDKIK